MKVLYTAWLPEEKEFVFQNYQTMPIRKMAEHLQRSFHSVEGFLLRKHLMGQRFSVKRRSRPELTELQWAYLAGIIDGEGTITINRHKQYLVPSLQVSNTSYSLMETMISWGFWKTVTRNTRGVRAWRIQLGGWQIEPILISLRPYLIIKKEHCDLVLQFLTLRKQFHKFLTPEMQEIHQKIRLLNKRGSRFEKELERHKFMILSQPATRILPTGS